MVKSLLTSPRDARAPFPAPCSWENTLSHHSAALFLFALHPRCSSFPRNAGIPPQFKHVGPHPDQNRTPVTSLVPASQALECAGSDFLGSTALCGFAPFPGRSQGKQRPQPLSSAARNRGPYTESCKQKVSAILLHFDSLWVRKHGKNSQRGILMSYLYNTHIPSSLLAQSSPCQQQKHSVFPKVCYQWAAVIQPLIKILRLNSKGIPSTWCG